MTSQTSIFNAYWELCKPRVVALMLLTALIGMLLATPNAIPIPILVFGMLGIALASGSAAAVNHILDRHIDSVMARTQRRPLPKGQLSTKQAASFAVVMGFSAILILHTFVNDLTALLTMLTLVGYAVVYTLFLKHATPQNIVIGGAAGAAPPLLGWVAVTNEVHANALLLVLIIYVWTPPHFWALAVHRYKEYEKAKVPMLPVTHGIPFTKICITLYSFLLLAVSVLPVATGMSHWLYLVSAVALGLLFVYKALTLQFKPTNRSAINLFRYSIIYLMLLFLALLLDHYF